MLSCCVESSCEVPIANATLGGVRFTAVAVDEVPETRGWLLSFVVSSDIDMCRSLSIIVDGSWLVSMQPESARLGRADSVSHRVSPRAPKAPRRPNAKLVAAPDNVPVPGKPWIVDAKDSENGKQQHFSRFLVTFKIDQRTE